MYRYLEHRMYLYYNLMIVEVLKVKQTQSLATRRTYSLAAALVFQGLLFLLKHIGDISA